MSKIRLGAIGQIAVMVKDLKRAVTFYRDVLGMEFLFDAGNLAFFNVGGVRLMLSTGEGEENLGHLASVLYYRVADLEGTYEQLKGQGVAFEDEPHLIARMPDHELWMAFFRDSEDNMLALMAEKPLPVAAVPPAPSARA